MDKYQNKYTDKPSQIPEHDCNGVNKGYTNTSDYTLTKCMICDKILEFRWKSFRKRIKGIF